MTSINVKELYFEFQELTPLNSEPAFDTLQKFLTQLKVNTSYLPTNIRHGCIGIILSAASYATLAPLTPLISPTHLGTLTIPPISAQYAIAILKTQHDNAMKTYYLYLIVQRALIQQVLDAIE